MPRLLAALAAVLLLLPGCKREGACESVNDCIAAEEEQEVSFGLVWTCNEENTCENTACENSDDCELYQHCKSLPVETEDAVPEKFCAEGCSGDSDCPAGAFCQAGTCEPKPCRNGHLDCDLAEVCEGGVCVDAGFPFCNSCNPQQNIYDQGSDLDPCDTRATGHQFCGDGNFCWNLPNGPSCGVPCDENADCPGGFSCGQALISGPQCPGDVIVVGKYCVSDFCFEGF